MHNVGCEIARVVKQHDFFWKEPQGLHENKAQCCPLQINLRKSIANRALPSQHSFSGLCGNKMVECKSTSI